MQTHFLVSLSITPFHLSLSLPSDSLGVVELVTNQSRCTLVNCCCFLKCNAAKRAIAFHCKHFIGVCFPGTCPASFVFLLQHLNMSVTSCALVIMNICLCSSHLYMLSILFCSQILFKLDCVSCYLLPWKPTQSLTHAVLYDLRLKMSMKWIGLYLLSC